MHESTKAAFVLLTALFVPFVASSQTVQNELTQQEHTASSYLAGPRADGARYMALAAPDYVLVDPSGAIYTAVQSLAAFRACNFSSFQIKDMKVRSLSPESAIAVMHVTLQGTCGGQKVPPNYVMVDTWVKRGGKWLIQLHTETVAILQK